MNILSLSTDRSICVAQSPARKRQEAYAARAGATTIIVCTRPGAAETHSGPVRIIPTNSSSPLWYGWDVLRIIRALPVHDLITVQDPFETGLLGLVIAWWQRVPLHVQVHTDFTSTHFVQHSVLNRVRRVLAWIVLPHATRIRVIAESMADLLRKKGITAPISVLPIFVDVARYAHIARLKHPRFMAAFVYVGRLESEKRPELAIATIAAARKAGHDAGLTVVGEGKERAALEAQARSLGIERSVDFVGWQSDIAPYLAQADALLLPSRYEGYGLVVVEALAAGIPVIATDVGVAREVGAIVVPEKGFTQSVIEWIGHGPRTASLVHYPYRDFDDYVDQYVADIRTVVETRV